MRRHHAPQSARPHWQRVVARAVLALSAAAVVYILVTGGLGALRTHQLRQDEERLQAEVAQLQERQRWLEALRDYMQSDEFLEMMARQQLGLVRPGEKGIMVVSPSPTPAPTPTDGRPWWERLLP
ncbi:MAG TPA: septum formation initiator family protein [Dehalococcoidia bacterium]|nr:septum formation initiator family protein [Dehalococcoidia bacterium]